MSTDPSSVFPFLFLVMETLYKKTYEKFNTRFHHDFNIIPDKTKVSDDIFELSQSAIYATERHPLFRDSSFNNSEEEFEKNYGNPMTSVYLNRLTLVVEKNEEKVSIKMFHYHKHRDAGKVYFIKTSNMLFITYKFKTNELYNGSMTNQHKKRKFRKSIKKNYFAFNPFSNMHLVFHNHHNSYTPVDEEKNRKSTVKIFNEVFNIFTSNIPNFNHDGNDNLTWDDVMYKHYLKVNNIKYPDNFKVFKNFIPIPNKRKLKKCKYKLVDTHMFINNINGDKLRKILHNVNFVNFKFYKSIEDFFGESFLKSKSDSIIKTILEVRDGFLLPEAEGMTNAEKKNFFDILLCNLDEYKNYSTFYTLTDHVNFYNRLKKFEKIKWKSNNMDSFNEEHIEWSNKIQKYTTGIYTRYYNSEFIDAISKPIKVDGVGDFFPVVLTNSDEYNKESLVQSNCVKTYVNRCGSFCLSLRKGSKESETRATIEFLILEMNDGSVGFRRVQTLGKYNRNLDESWDTPLMLLDVTMNQLSRMVKIELPKIKVEINGREFFSDSEFNKNTLSPKWISNIINHTLPNYLLDDY